VLEIVRSTEGQVETIGAREVLAIHEETVPLVRLSQAFNLPPAETGDAFYVILVGLAERRLGIVVDNLRDQQEIVIKRLGKRIENTPGIAGATELEDQRGVVLVVDVESLINTAFTRVQKVQT
ncbi:MAG TPA: chemotaxis protein CheA, partial [Nitrospiraceae bacterium]|nr:chemotaxis protein CheA [Nitrospiraceae bacterium]